MRTALKSAIGLLVSLRLGRSVEWQKELFAEIEASLNSDAGRDHFSRSQVQPIVNALSQLYELSASVPSEAKAIARDALDYAGTLGF